MHCAILQTDLAIRVRNVGFESGLGLSLGSGVGQKYTNCKYAISKLNRAFSKLCRLTNISMWQELTTFGSQDNTDLL